MDIRDRLWRLLALFPATLARAGPVDRERAEEAFNLAVLVMMTG